MLQIKLSLTVCTAVMYYKINNKSVAADKKEEPVTIPNTEVKLLQIQPFAVICRAFLF